MSGLRQVRRMTEGLGELGEVGAAFQGSTVRDRLVSALRVDLLGPENPEELLAQSPATRYLVGMLAPRDTEVDPIEDDQATDGGEEPGAAGDPLETPPPL